MEEHTPPYLELRLVHLAMEAVVVQHYTSSWAPLDAYFAIHDYLKGNLIVDVAFDYYRAVYLALLYYSIGLDYCAHTLVHVYEDILLLGVHDGQFCRVFIFCIFLETEEPPKALRDFEVLLVLFNLRVEHLAHLLKLYGLLRRSPLPEGSRNRAFRPLPHTL